jgi:hypothetical protein
MGKKFGVVRSANKTTFLSDSSGFSLLHKAQISALESLDCKINRLLDLIPKPLLLVISGNHGECFGEDGLWGHGFPHPRVMQVPLLIAQVL